MFKDIYFKPLYGKVHEGIENGKVDIFKYESNLGSVTNMFIKRKISIVLDGIHYCDIITPYGYGGPIINNCIDENLIPNLVEEYSLSFKKYCLENNIVSEFVRFHPILENHNNFSDVYSISYMRKTLGTNLLDFDDPFQNEFSKSSRKSVRRAIKDGVTFEIEENPDNIDDFINIYYSTMDRNNADDFYYFDDEYFTNLLNNLKNHIIIAKAKYMDKTIASGLYFVFGDFIHAHLSGTLREFLYLSPAYILKYGTVVWGKNNGYKLIHYGGGISNAKDDDLYKFKKKFAKHTSFNYYIGKKIWNSEVYNNLCKKKSIRSNIDFFPAYRK